MAHESILVAQESILVAQEAILVAQESILVPQEAILGLVQSGPVWLLIFVQLSKFGPVRLLNFPVRSGPVVGMIVSGPVRISIFRSL